MTKWSKIDSINMQYRQNVKTWQKSLLLLQYNYGHKLFSMNNQLYSNYNTFTKDLIFGILKILLKKNHLKENLVNLNMQPHCSSYPWLASTEDANTFGPTITGLHERRMDTLVWSSYRRTRMSTHRYVAPCTNTLF